MSDSYFVISKDKLSLKTDETIKKKKKKSKEKKELIENKIKTIKDDKLSKDLIKLYEEKRIDEQALEKLNEKEIVKSELTKAELAFRNMQEKKQAERILNKAMKTHKQRVEEFNSHLDSLSEHYDIPKVSWTK